MNRSNELRVFISSTFRDLQEEREHLVKKIFPELRQTCRERGITFTEIDLRWGITERQARRRKIVSTCLDEIHRHKPYIIGIVGERCGWKPGHEDLGRDASVLERYPWLRAAIDEQRSLVELETVESTRHNAALRDRTRFYFRTSVDSDDGATQLKDRIRASGLKVREPYGDVETLGAWVREDLLAEIERMQPSNRNLSFVEQERRGHESFAASRRRVYVEHRPTLKRLDEHVTKDEGGRMKDEAEIVRDSSSSFRLHPSSFPLVVTGDSGSGKSSLLSYWSDRFRREHPDAFIVTHHVGATATSTSHLGLLRHVMLEIKERFDVGDEVPTAPEKIEGAFRYWLGYASRGGMVLVIDALNQLSEFSRRSLKWLPDYFPPYVRVIVSTLNGEILEQLKQWNWQVLKVKTLTKGEREQVVKGYFKSFGKELDAKNVRRLVADTKSISPLYLVTTLEELRVFGSYEDISNKIGHYLEADDLDDLFQRVLARLEQDYGKKPVREVMSVIWASRNGLTETDVVEMTGCNRLDLSRLLHALEYHLLQREGLLGFFHDFLRRGVEKRYLSRASVRRDRSDRNAAYFEALDVTLHSTQELLHALESLGNRERLIGSLAEIPRLEVMWPGDGRHEVLRICSGSGKDEVVAAMRASLAHWRRERVPSESHQAAMLNHVAKLFEAVGAWNDAESVHLEQLDLLSTLAESVTQSLVLSSLSDLCQRSGRTEEAEIRARAAEAIARRLKDPRCIAIAVGIRGNIHWMRGEYSEALECYDVQEKTGLDCGNRQNVLKAIGNRGVVHWSQGEYEKAIVCFGESESIAREAGDRRCVADAIGNRGLVHFIRGEFDIALALFGETQKISLELGDRQSIANAFGHRGVVHKDRGEYDEASECFRQCELIARELGDQRAIFSVLANRGVLHKDRGEYDEALVCLWESERIARELGDRRGIAHTLENRGKVEYERREYKDALASHSQAESICRQIGYPYLLVYCLWGSARILLECSQFPTMPLYLQEAIGLVDTANWRDATLHRSRELAAECVQMSREISRMDTLFECEVVLAGIDAVEGRLSAALRNLNQILEATTDDERCAELHYWLWKLHRAECMPGAPPASQSDRDQSVSPVGRATPNIQSGSKISSHSDPQGIPLEHQESSAHRTESLQLFKRLVDKMPKFEFKRRIAELQTGLDVQIDS